MKKNTIIILLMSFVLSLSAQDITPLDKIFDEISVITSVPRSDIKQKINHGDGVVMYVHNHPIGKEILCSKECGSSYIGNMTDEEARLSNEHNKKIFDGIFHAVGHNLDSLMEMSDESYHYETHKDGKDTIKYSICMKNGADKLRKIKAIDGSMIYPDAVETVSLNYTADKKACGKHTRGFGILSYNKNVFLPGRKSYTFDKALYLPKILPILKRKGVKSWKFSWTQSEDYDLDAHWNEEFHSGETAKIRTKDGKISNAGKVLGTMYFIPREKEKLADAIFTEIDSITLNHTEIYPEQMFMYAYNVKEHVMQYKESSSITQLFYGMAEDSGPSIRVLFGITQKGYYVAVAETEYNFCIPKEWAVLKSFNNGKKEYVK